MSRRDAAAAGQRARHARDRLQATLGDASRGLLTGDRPADGGGGEPFEYGGDSPLHPDSGHPGGTRPSVRWRLGMQAAVLLGVLAVAAGALFWWQAAAGRPDVLPLDTISRDTGPSEVDGSPPAQPSGSAAATPAPSGNTMVVHVSGAVRAPGVVALPPGSRVHQAIELAGGAADDADLDALNLAQEAADGQKIHVPRHGEPPDIDDGAARPGTAAPSGQALPGKEAKVNLNTAGVEELDTLPKVGPVLAQRIVDWRAEHGPFAAVEDLDAVDGVGPKMLESLLPLVTV